MPTDMPISALAPWYGSKRTLAPRIVTEFGSHAAYWEPFCGSCAVFFEKTPCRMETLNDLHGDLINLALCVQDLQLATQLYGELDRMLFHEDLHADLIDYLDPGWCMDGPCVQRAVAFLYVSWAGRNGTTGTVGKAPGFAVRFTKGGGHAATRFHSMVASIPAWHERLKEATILSRDGLELIDKIGDETETVVYCDPPYLAKTKKYVHDFEVSQHLQLASLLCRFQKTRVFVSYYDHPQLSALYPEWEKIDLTCRKSLANASTAETVDAAPEVLLTNRRLVAI